MLEARACCEACGKHTGCFIVKSGGQLLCFECAPPRLREIEPRQRTPARIIDFAVYRSRREIREYRAS